MAHRCVTALATLIVVVVVAAPAGAATRTARFDVTLKGTYATTAVATETGCYTLDAQGRRVPLADQSGRAAETTTVASTRANAIQVSRTDRAPLVAGRVARTRTLPLAVR